MFELALTGDYLNVDGRVAYGDIRMALLDAEPRIRYRFLTDQAPKTGDSEYWRGLYSMEVTPEQIAGLDGLVVLRPWVPARTVEAAADRLIVIGRSGAGYDKIDVDACTAHDIALFNAPFGLNHSTASTALMFMLALAKKLRQQERITREGRWDLQPEVMGNELRGRTLGIVGLGHSGQELSRLVAPFGMRLITYSPHANPAVAEELGVNSVGLQHLFEVSDFISLHSRLTPLTQRMIFSELIACMKPTAYFINVARGELVDEAALIDALANHRIAGAALDVFLEEPLPIDHPLLALDNVILTPHWSASTTDVWAATGEAMARGMISAASGQVPDNVVNTKVLDRPGFQAKLARFRE